jgi:hypothetical protein
MIFEVTGQKPTDGCPWAFGRGQTLFVLPDRASLLVCGSSFASLGVISILYACRLADMSVEQLWKNGGH